jgi:hypothetical protein
MEKRGSFDGYKLLKDADLGREDAHRARESAMGGEGGGSGAGGGGGGGAGLWGGAGAGLGGNGRRSCGGTTRQLPVVGRCRLIQ